jgi:hypothetical protein
MSGDHVKNLVIVSVMSLCIATTALAEERTWTGTISDKMCGADHTKMGGKLSERDCTLACAKGGAPYVFVSEGKVYQLTNHDADLKTHAGHTVNLSGDLKGDMIRVSKIEMAASQK